MAAPDREKQLAEAEEILGDRLQQVGFVKGLFFGHFIWCHFGERLSRFDRIDNEAFAFDRVRAGFTLRQRPYRPNTCRRR